MDIVFFFLQKVHRPIRVLAAPTDYSYLNLNICDWLTLFRPGHPTMVKVLFTQGCLNGGETLTWGFSWGNCGGRVLEERKELHFWLIWGFLFTELGQVLITQCLHTSVIREIQTIRFFVPDANFHLISLSQMLTFQGKVYLCFYGTVWLVLILYINIDVYKNTSIWKFHFKGEKVVTFLKQRRKSGAYMSTQEE